MKKLSEIFKKVNQGVLLLPDFQRDYKWDWDKQRSLLASLLLGFPVGSILILKGNSNAFASRKIGDIKQAEQGDDFKCEYLLDGQQRTTTLYNALNNFFLIMHEGAFDSESKDEIERKLKASLSGKANKAKVRWFLKFPNGEESTKDVSDLFGAKSLKFTIRDIEDFEPEDIFGNIKDFRFDEKRNLGVTKWYSPFYEISYRCSGKTEKQFATNFVECCAENSLLPLFLIGESKEPKARIVKRVLGKVAQKNSQAIKDKIQYDLSEIKKFDGDGLLDDYETISEIENSGKDFESLIDEVFKAVEEKWVGDVNNYLVQTLYKDYELLSLETPDIRRAIPIFCHLNEGGMKLDDFDLLAARAAKKLAGDSETYSLSEVVRFIFKKPIELSSPLTYETSSVVGCMSLENFDSVDNGLPNSYIKSSILVICSLLAHAKKVNFYEDKSIELTKDQSKSKVLLTLSTQEIRDNIEIAAIAVLRAFAFLNIRCGIHNAKHLHYKLMIQPIAFAFTNNDNWADKTKLSMIEEWYWSALFSGAYLYDQSTVVIQDINSLYRGLVTGDKKELEKRQERIFNHADFCSKEFLTMKGEESPKAGIRTAILQFVLSQKPYDLIAGEVEKTKAFRLNSETKCVELLKKNSLHDHHIIPLDVGKNLGERTEAIRNDPSHILNSPLNRVFISASANEEIGSLDPARYFEVLGNHGEHKENILSSNCIPTSFSDINTESYSGNATKVMEDRFDSIKNKVLERILTLKS
jgi:hypothetical protein